MEILVWIIILVSSSPHLHSHKLNLVQSIRENNQDVWQLCCWRFLYFCMAFCTSWLLVLVWFFFRYAKSKYLIATVVILSFVFISDFLREKFNQFVHIRRWGWTVDIWMYWSRSIQSCTRGNLDPSSTSHGPPSTLCFILNSFWCCFYIIILYSNQQKIFRVQYPPRIQCDTKVQFGDYFHSDWKVGG